MLAVLAAMVGLQLLLNALAAALVLLRARLYRVRVYRPMLLNIGLSLVPVLAVGLLVVGGFVIVAVPALSSRSLLLTFLAAVTALWLLFFPNSAYLITELNFSHRRADDPVPLWYDIIATLTLTVSGVANAVASLSAMTILFVALVDPNRTGPFAPWWAWLFAFAVVVLGSFGIYLGRNLRFNSWDVRTPWSLAAKVVRHLAAPGTAGPAALYSAFLGVVFALTFLPVYAAVA